MVCRSLTPPAMTPHTTTLLSIRIYLRFDATSHAMAIVVQDVSHFKLLFKTTIQLTKLKQLREMCST